MNPVNKKLFIPVIIFLGILAVNVNTIIHSIDAHQTWRVVVASVSSLLIIAMMVLVVLRINKMAKQHKENMN